MVYRIIDANINRACEGVRVLEDYFRFVKNDRALSSQLRKVRHELRQLYCPDELIKHRDSANDVGRITSMQAGDDHRIDSRDLLSANFKRAQEAIRVVEENLKLVDEYPLSKEYEKLRFSMYQLEKAALRKWDYSSWDIYAITCEKYCDGKDNIEVVQELLENGIKVLQYREKEKSKREKLLQCQKIRTLTKEYGCTFIVNDDLDIALLCEADGVHLGQTDLPIKEARKISQDLIIGVSTHNPEQAQKALSDGADYIGVGPMFPTSTKTDLEPSESVDYLQYTCENIPLPKVAIGGIDTGNIDKLLKVSQHAASPVSFALIGGLLRGNLRENIITIRKIIKEYRDV